MNQFPYLYPHSLSEVERLNEEELWQDNRDAEVSHTQLTEICGSGWEHQKWISLSLTSKT